MASWTIFYLFNSLKEEKKINDKRIKNIYRRRKVVNKQQLLNSNLNSLVFRDIRRYFYQLFGYSMPGIKGSGHVGSAIRHLSLF